MEVDRELIMKGGLYPRLRFYQWNGFCITAGMFLESHALLDFDYCQRMNVEMAKRPTGGGVLFHGSDCALSLFFPGKTIDGTVEECCRRINEPIVKALRQVLPPEESVSDVRSHGRCQFCMAQATVFDLVWGGKKIGGCAQRKTRAGLLHQVSLFLTAPDWKSIAPCVKDGDEIRRMQQVSRSLEEMAQRAILQYEIHEAITNSFLEWRI